MTAIGSVPRGNICIHSGMLFIGAEDLQSGCGSGPTPSLPQTKQIALRKKLRRPIRGAASRVRRKHSSGVGTKQTQSQRESARSPASSRKAAAGARGWVNSWRKSSLKTMTHRVVRRHQTTVVEGLKWRRKLPLPVRATARWSSKTQPMAPHAFSLFASPASHRAADLSRSAFPAENGRLTPCPAGRFGR